MGNGWMSPLDQGKYASYLFFHGLLDKAQYQQLDEIGEQLDALSLRAVVFGCLSLWLHVTLSFKIIAAISKKIVLTDGQILSTIAQQKWLEAWQGDYFISLLSFHFIISINSFQAWQGDYTMSFFSTSFCCHFIISIYSFEAWQGDYIRVIFFQSFPFLIFL